MHTQTYRDATVLCKPGGELDGTAAANRVPRQVQLFNGVHAGQHSPQRARSGATNFASTHVESRKRWPGRFSHDCRRRVTQPAVLQLEFDNRCCLEGVRNGSGAMVPNVVT